MGLCRKENVLNLADSPSEEREQPLLDIDGIIDDANDYVYDVTDTDEDFWILGSTRGYATARMIAELTAAAKILQSWQDIQNKRQGYLDEADKKLTALKRAGYGPTQDGDNRAFRVGSSKYKAIANNPNVGRYLSRNAFGGDQD